MSRGTAIAAAIAAALLGGVALAWLLPGPADTGPTQSSVPEDLRAPRQGPSAPGRSDPDADPRGTAPAGHGAEPGRTQAEQDDDDDARTAAGRHATRAIDPNAPGANVPFGDADDGGASGGASTLPDGFRNQASAERADWLEDRMRDFLIAVEPELQDAGLSRSCTSSGRSCTFEGPMTDDFVRQWFEALAQGEMTHEGVLQGTTFSEFGIVDGDDGKRFTITAKHPTAQ